MKILFMPAFLFALTSVAFAAGDGEQCGTIAGIECEKGLYCDTGIGSCGVADAEGVCKAKPEICTEEFMPVCGCDKRTYSNACQAAAAGVVILKNGECEDPTGALGPCNQVGKGGVGESGASSKLDHVTGPSKKMMVLRTTSTSLCSNTGAVAMLAIDGGEAASGTITENGATIQAEAAPESNVTVLVNTVPRPGGIVCVRLGELEFELQECDIVE